MINLQSCFGLCMLFLCAHTHISAQWHDRIWYTGYSDDHDIDGWGLTELEIEETGITRTFQDWNKFFFI